MTTEYTALQSLAQRLESECGTVCSLEEPFPMLDVWFRGQHFVVDYDNGAPFEPRNLYRVANVTIDYAFNMSGDPAFGTIQEAEEYLKLELARVASHP